MLEKHALLFVEAAIVLSETKWVTAEAAHAKQDDSGIRSTIVKLGRDAIHKLRRSCILSDMDDMTPEIDRVSQSFELLLSKPDWTLDNVAHGLKHLISRVQDELKSEYYFHVDQRDVAFYVAETPFGKMVADKFSGAAEDIAEASKCLGLQRPTACVFHLMRTLERGVQALGKKLRVKIDVRAQTWHHIMQHVEKALNALPIKTSLQKSRKSQFAIAVSYLQTVRIAWRNEVMHPKQSYTRQEAFDIFNASKVFMMHLAGLV